MQTWKMLLVMKNINWAIKQFFLFKSKLSFFFPSKSRFMFDYHCRILCGVSQNLPCHGNVPSFPGEIMSPKRIQISKNRWLDSLKIKKTAWAILQLRDIFLFILFCFVFLSFFVENTHSKKLSINESNTSFRLIIFNTLVSFVSGVVAKWNSLWSPGFRCSFLCGHKLRNTPGITVLW